MQRKLVFEQTITLPQSTSEQELLDILEGLNRDDSVDGILVQLPLPKHIDSQKVLECIEPSKDVDGFHPINVGQLHSGIGGYIPCTAQGVIDILEDVAQKEEDFSIEGKVAVVIGRSNIVGQACRSTFGTTKCNCYPLSFENQRSSIVDKNRRYCCSCRWSSQYDYRRTPQRRLCCH